MNNQFTEDPLNIINKFCLILVTICTLSQQTLSQVCDPTIPPLEPITSAVNTPLFDDLGLRVSYIGADPSDNTRLRIQTRKNGALTTHFIKLNGLTASGQFGVFNSLDSRYYIKTIETSYTVVNSNYSNRWRIFGFVPSPFPPINSSFETSSNLTLTGSAVSSPGGIANNNLGYMFRMQVSDTGSLFFESTNAFGGTSGTSLITYSCSQYTHNGFSQITAENTNLNLQNGQAAATTTTGVVKLNWGSMVNQGEINGFRIYRKLVPNGSFTAIADLPATARSYTDQSNLSSLNTYQYLLRPLSIINSLEVAPTNENANLQPQVTIPPENMVFIHKSTLNKESCERIIPLASQNSTTIDVLNNNRCIYTGRGQNNGFLEYSKSLIVDKFELGCKVGNGVTLNGGNCTINGKTVSSNDITATELLQATTNSPGHSPLIQIAPYNAFRVCDSQQFSINNLTVRKRLLTMKEFRAVSAWAPDLTQEQITQTETGQQVGGRNNVCNSASGQLTQTGSTSTNLCVSRYGIQDLIGNVEEYVSDRVDYQTNCEDVFNNVGDSHSFAPTNTDLHGFNFIINDQRTEPQVYTHNLGAINQYLYFNPILGLANKSDLNPITNDKPMSEWFSKVGQQTLNGMGGWCTRLSASISLGGRANSGVQAGRWHTNAESTVGYSEKTNSAGARCVMEVN